MELLAVEYFGIGWNGPVYKVARLCSVFQVEVVAIQAAARIIGDKKFSKRNISILSDSQQLSRL